MFYLFKNYLYYFAYHKCLIHVYQVEFKWRKESAYSRIRDYPLLLSTQNGDKMGTIFKL